MTSIPSAGAPSVRPTFSRLDSDGNGKLDKSEFTAALPEGVSEQKASAAFDRLSEGEGISADDLASRLDDLRDGARARFGGDLARTMLDGGLAGANITPADTGTSLDSLLATLDGGDED